MFQNGNSALGTVAQSSSSVPPFFFFFGLRFRRQPMEEGINLFFSMTSTALSTYIGLQSYQSLQTVIKMQEFNNQKPIVESRIDFARHGEQNGRAITSAYQGREFPLLGWLSATEKAPCPQSPATSRMWSASCFMSPAYLFIY